MEGWKRSLLITYLISSKLTDRHLKPSMRGTMPTFPASVNVNPLPHPSCIHTGKKNPKNKNLLEVQQLTPPHIPPCTCSIIHHLLAFPYIISFSWIKTPFLILSQNWGLILGHFTLEDFLDLIQSLVSSHLALIKSKAHP